MRVDSLSKPFSSRLFFFIRSIQLTFTNPSFISNPSPIHQISYVYKAFVPISFKDGYLFDLFLLRKVELLLVWLQDPLSRLGYLVWISQSEKSLFILFKLAGVAHVTVSGGFGYASLMTPFWESSDMVTNRTRNALYRETGSMVKDLISLLVLTNRHYDLIPLSLQGVKGFSTIKTTIFGENKSYDMMGSEMNSVSPIYARNLFGVTPQRKFMLSIQFSAFDLKHSCLIMVPWKKAFNCWYNYSTVGWKTSTLKLFDRMSHRKPILLKMKVLPLKRIVCCKAITWFFSFANAFSLSVLLGTVEVDTQRNGINNSNLSAIYSFDWLGIYASKVGSLDGDVSIFNQQIVNACILFDNMSERMLWKTLVSCDMQIVAVMLRMDLIHLLRLFSLEENSRDTVSYGYCDWSSVDRNLCPNHEGPLISVEKGRLVSLGPKGFFDGLLDTKFNNEPVLELLPICKSMKSYTVRTPYMKSCCASNLGGLTVGWLQCHLSFEGTCGFNKGLLGQMVFLLVNCLRTIYNCDCKHRFALYIWNSSAGIMNHESGSNHNGRLTYKFLFNHDGNQMLDLFEWYGPELSISANGFRYSLLIPVEENACMRVYILMNFISCYANQADANGEDDAAFFHNHDLTFIVKQTADFEGSCFTCLPIAFLGMKMLSVVTTAAVEMNSPAIKLCLFDNCWVLEKIVWYMRDATRFCFLMETNRYLDFPEDGFTAGCKKLWKFRYDESEPAEFVYETQIRNHFNGLCRIAWQDIPELKLGNNNFIRGLLAAPD